MCESSFIRKHCWGLCQSKLVPKNSSKLFLCDLFLKYIVLPSQRFLCGVQEKPEHGYLFDGEGKCLDCARTLFVWVFQLWQLLFHCRSCVACITPSTLLPSTPFPPLGAGIPVSHVLSVRLQAPLRTAQLSSVPFFSLFSPHPSWQFLCISLHHLSPQWALHFFFLFFYHPFPSPSRFHVPGFTYSKGCSADSSCCTWVCLPSNLKSVFLSVLLVLLQV